MFGIIIGNRLVNLVDTNNMEGNANCNQSRIYTICSRSTFDISSSSKGSYKMSDCSTSSCTGAVTVSVTRTRLFAFFTKSRMTGVV